MNINKDILVSLVMDLPSDYHNEVFKAVATLLTGQPVKRESIYAWVIPLLPYIGATAIDVGGKVSVARTVRGVFSEKYRDGVVYETMTLEDLKLFGFHPYEVGPFLKLYRINRNMRRHFIRYAKEVFIAPDNSFRDARPTRIEIKTVEDMIQLDGYANDKLMLFPRPVNHSVNVDEYVINKET